MNDESTQPNEKDSKDLTHGEKTEEGKDIIEDDEPKQEDKKDITDDEARKTEKTDGKIESNDKIPQHNGYKEKIMKQKMSKKQKVQKRLHQMVTIR